MRPLSRRSTPFHRLPLPILFGLTLFLSACLSFLVQPMIAKALLPYFGGSPAVWTVSMLFFQTGLLLGYSYAHLLSSTTPTTIQVLVHFCLMVLMVLVSLHSDRFGIGFVVDEVNKTPIWTLFVTLLKAVGLPFFALATTAPLLQRWYVSARGYSSRDPYFLYAASNSGSLLALIGFPIWLERRYPLAEQARKWSLGLTLLAGLVIVCGVSTLLGQRKSRGVIPKSLHAPFFRSRYATVEFLLWVALSFVPSSLLLGVTTYITTDLAAIPLLWAIPLGIYLGTFVVVFSRLLDAAEWIGRRILPPLVMVLAIVMAAGLVQPWLIPLHLLTFTAAALVCHGALAKRRPEPEHLTVYFLAIAIGGALGGVFNAILSPLLFTRLSEYPLVIVWACLALSAEGESDETLSWRTLTFPIMIGTLSIALFSNYRGINETAFGIVATMLAAGLTVLIAWTHRAHPVRFALTIAALLAASGFTEGVNGRVIFRERSFFGLLTVTELQIDGEPVHRMFHGSTLHGQQNMLPEKRRIPQTYFERSGPIGQLFQQFEAGLHGRDGRIAVTGVGAGSLAAYARPGQLWTFHEIDPMVDRVARDARFFTYFHDSKALRLATIIGDARLTMAKAEDQAYDLIILDAFSSDAIPAHLLTREALALYRRKIGPEGLIAINITNRYLDLAPVVAALAQDANWVARVRIDADHTRVERERGSTGSIWAVLASDELRLGKLTLDKRWFIPEPKPGTTLWTDDFTSLVDHLRFGNRAAR